MLIEAMAQTVKPSVIRRHIGTRDCRGLNINKTNCKSCTTGTQPSKGLVQSQEEISRQLYPSLIVSAGTFLSASKAIALNLH